MDTRTVEALVGDRWEPCNFEDLNIGCEFYEPPRPEQIRIYLKIKGEMK